MPENEKPLILKDFRKIKKIKKNIAALENQR